MGPLPVEAVETLPFNPPLPFLALALALLAVPAARAVRRLGAETAHRPWPAGWDGGQAARHATGGLLAFIGLCLAPVALQPAAVALPGAVGRELAWLAQAAWGALVLLGPLLWALAQVAELRWPATALRALTAVALAPLGAVMAAGWAPPGSRRRSAGLARRGAHASAAGPGGGGPGADRWCRSPGVRGCPSCSRPGTGRRPWTRPPAAPPGRQAVLTPCELSSPLGALAAALSGRRDDQSPDHPQRPRKPGWHGRCTRG
ncbi:MAG: hypothetical protein H6702_19925 [Myxococcales bacterium]|nr:hypothetical protein [Myxococcales bacterium]